MMRDTATSPARPETGSNSLRNAGTALQLDWVGRAQVNTSASRNARGHAHHAADGQEGVAGRVAGEGDHAASTSPRFPATTRQGRVAAALRQGAAAAPRRPRRGARPGRRATPRSARSASIRRFVAPAVKALAGSGIPVASVSTGFPAGLAPLAHAARRDRGYASPRAPTRSTSSSPASTCSPATGRRSTTRSRAMQRRLRRRPYEGDPRHRRPEDAAQRRQRLHGRHDGRRRLHQDLDRQGRRQRDAARSASSWCAPSATIASMTGYRRRLQAGRRHLARPRTR